MFDFFLEPTDVQAAAICLIWCRVVRSCYVRSHDFSAPDLTYNQCPHSVISYISVYVLLCALNKKQSISHYCANAQIEKFPVHHMGRRTC